MTRKRYTSMGQRNVEALALARTAFRESWASDVRRREFSDLGERVDNMLRIVYAYTDIDDRAFDTDDEIINWTFVDVAYDLTGAICAIAAGCYKMAASSLRNALDLGVCSLYFQVRQNEQPYDGYNSFFAEWDRGDKDTPNWGEMRTVIQRLASIERFDAKYGCNVINDAYQHFRYLR